MPAFASSALVASRPLCRPQAQPSRSLCSEFVQRPSAGSHSASRSQRKASDAPAAARFEVLARHDDEALGRRGALRGLVLAAAAALAAPSASRADVDLSGYKTLDLNVQYKDLKLGDPSGPSMDPGTIVTVRLSEGSEEGEPFSFKYGKSEVPLGLEIAVKGMKPGGKRTIILPPELNPKPTERNKSVSLDIELVALSECVEKNALGFITFKECK